MHRPTYEELQKKIDELEREAAKHVEIESALRESELFLSRVISQNPFPIWIGDSKGTIEQCNQALLDLLQLEEDKLVGKYNILEDPLIAHLREDIHKIFDEGETFRFEVEWEANPSIGVDSPKLVIAGIVFPVFNREGKIVNTVATYHDITALRKSEETFRTIVEQLPVMITSFDQDQKCAIWNQETTKQFGYTIEEFNNAEEIIKVLFPEAEAQQFASDLSEPIDEPSGEPFRQFRRFHPTTKSGKKRIQDWASFSLPDGRRVSIGLDVTERVQAEEALKAKEQQLQRAQKMETVGVLAGGIAHEFNNLLHIITTNMERLACRTDLQNDPPFASVVKSAKRGTSLVKQLLAFSRKSETALLATHLDLEIIQITDMLRRLLPRMIVIDLEIADNIPPIMGDPGQIEQVVTNLCLNAKDAMPDGGTISIKLEVRNATHLGRCKTCGKTPDAGDYVVLTISDNGIGMDEKTMERIFEPFFTTKTKSEGTGLGLSVVFGIIQGHHGHISCSSEKGRGTAFSICFPVGVDPKKDSRLDRDLEMRPSAGNETVLIVDDEEAIREATSELLQDLNYRTLLADSGEAAVDLFAARQREISLVLLDLSMPGMGGHRCLEKLLEIDPRTKIVVSSGYSEGGLIQNTVTKGAKDFLMKPYGIKSLSRMVRRVLDQK